MDGYLLLTPQMPPVVLHVLHCQLINATDGCAFDSLTVMGVTEDKNPQKTQCRLGSHYCDGHRLESYYSTKSTVDSITQ